MAGWEHADYEVLFRNHPPDEPTAPTREQADALGMRLDGCVEL